MTVRVGVDPALRAMPSTAIDSIVGKRAALDIAGGGLVTAADVTDAVVPTSGKSVVGLSLVAGQLPSQPLRVGDEVEMVSTPGSQGDVNPRSLTVFEGTVTDVAAPDASGKASISVEVDALKAPEIAARSASGRIALVLMSREK